MTAFGLLVVVGVGLTVLFLVFYRFLKNFVFNVRLSVLAAEVNRQRLDVLVQFPEFDLSRIAADLEYDLFYKRYDRLPEFSLPLLDFKVPVNAALRAAPVSVSPSLSGSSVAVWIYAGWFSPVVVMLVFVGGRWEIVGVVPAHMFFGVLRTSVRDVVNDWAGSTMVVRSDLAAGGSVGFADRPVLVGSDLAARVQLLDASLLDGRFDPDFLNLFVARFLVLWYEYQQGVSSDVAGLFAPSADPSAVLRSLRFAGRFSSGLLCPPDFEFVRVSVVSFDPVSSEVGLSVEVCGWFSSEFEHHLGAEFLLSNVSSSSGVLKFLLVPADVAGSGSVDPSVGVWLASGVGWLDPPSKVF